MRVAAACLGLCAVLFSFTGAASEDAGVDEAHLVVRKLVVGDACDIEKESKSCVVQGKDATVSYSIFNVGKGTAYDVKLTDASLEGDFGLVEPVALKFAKIGAGENITQNVTATPKSTGVIDAGAAIVSYQSTSDGEVLKGVSTSPENLFAESERANRKRTSFHWAEFGIFGVLSGLPIGIPLYISATTRISEQ